jgi:hypothetical protein
MRTFLIALAVLAVTAFACGDSSAVSPGSPATAKMTLAEFNSIQTGADCSKLPGLIGGPGKVLAESGTGDLKTVVYGWDGDGGTGANANVTCQNGAVVAKAQAGLR